MPMPKDLGMMEDDMGSIQDKRGMLSAAARKAPPQVAPKVPRPRPNPADAGIFTADKGIQPPSPDEGPTMTAPRGLRRGMKKGGCVKKAVGGSVGSASKRADGIAKKGKTKGRMV